MDYGTALMKTRPINYRVTLQGITYRVCTRDDRVLFIARQNPKSGEVGLMYGAAKFRQVVKRAEEEHKREFKWKAYVN